MVQSWHADIVNTKRQVYRVETEIYFILLQVTRITQLNLRKRHLSNAMYGETLRNGTRLAHRLSKIWNNLTKLSHVFTKPTSNCQSHRGETLNSCEMVQSWHVDLVNYENSTSLSRGNRNIFHFTTSYKNNLVKFVGTPPV